MRRLSKVYSIVVVCMLAALRGQAAQGEDHVYEWTRAFGGGGSDYWFSDMAIDVTSNIYVTGGFEGTVDFDPGTEIDSRTSLGGSDIVVSKFDSFGNYQWSRAFGSTEVDEYGKAIEVDFSGNVYVAGYFRGAVDFDPELGNVTKASAGSYDAFLSKFDASGSHLWVRTYGGVGSDVVNDVAIDLSGNIFVIGCFTGLVDFDPGVGVDNKTSNGIEDAYVTKYDESGHYLWTKVIGGTGFDGANAISLDANGNLYIVGGFSNTVDFDPGVITDTRTSLGDYDIFLTKYDSSGGYLWTQVIGGTGLDFASSISLDADGHLYIVGGFSNTVDFDPGVSTDTRTSSGDSDIFLTKYDLSGSYVWTKSFGGVGGDASWSGTVDGGGNIYLAGWFVGTIDFNAGPGMFNKTSMGNHDGFISKYDASGDYQWTITLGGTGDDWSYKLVFDTQSNLYLQGGFENTVDFDPGAGVDNRTSAGSIDAFVSKYTFDATPPLAPVVTLPTTGTSTSNTSTSINGTAEANSTITIYLNGTNTGTATADSSGTWTFNPSSPWLDGTYSITATATDIANNISALSSAVILTIDTLVPAVPVSSTPIWGNRTDDLAPTFSGTGEANASLKVWLDGLLVNTILIDSAGTWSWTPGSNLTLGTHSLELSVIDSAQNESAKSAAYSFQNVDDYDDDGLTTDEEASAGTDPHNADTDSDGLSDSQERTRATNPLDDDSDDDGVSDGQEVGEGTNPLDRGSVLARRDTTLCTEWNGFLGMWNVLEHVNTGTVKLSMESTLHDISGVAQAPVTFGLKSGYQYDLLVHGITGFEANRYGLICSTATNGNPGDLDGRMVFYKPDTASGGYQYAFALPFGNGLTGAQYVSYNTYQPSLDLSEAGNLAANWIQLTNLGGTKQSGALVFYNQAGKEIRRQSVTLKAGARFDYSAHDLAGVKQVGLVEWIPAINTVAFQLRNVRYYYRADGVTVSLGDDFASAFQLEGVVGNGELLSVPLDTDETSAVLELANTLAEEVKAEVTIYAASGGSILHHATYKLAPHATHHLITDSILDGGQGIATVRGNKTASVIATAMHYRRNDTLGLKNAYGIQAGVALGTAMRGSYNTFLKQGCRLLMVNPTAAEARARISMKRYDGTNVELGRLLAVPANGLTDYDLCREDEEDVYGVVTVQPDIPNTIFATVLRIGENEQYRFPTPVRE